MSFCVWNCSNAVLSSIWNKATNANCQYVADWGFAEWRHVISAAWSKWGRKYCLPTWVFNNWFPRVSRINQTNTCNNHPCTWYIPTFNIKHRNTSPEVRAGTLPHIQWNLNMLYSRGSQPVVQEALGLHKGCAGVPRKFWTLLFVKQHIHWMYKKTILLLWWEKQVLWQLHLLSLRYSFSLSSLWFSYSSVFTIFKKSGVPQNKSVGEPHSLLERCPCWGHVADKRQQIYKRAVWQLGF